MRPLHVIMPMAGEGSRFLKEGWTTPKPLIQLHGTELFLRAINSVKLQDAPMKYSFIVRQEHIDNYHIDEKIRAKVPDVNIFSVLKTTRGAVETCLIARPAIDREDAIVVMDCDLEFKSKEYVANIESILQKDVAEVNGGMLVSFDSDLPKYSYAEVDQNMNVIRTAEKEVISNHALCGAYFFSKAEGFLNAADAMLADTHFSKPEFYVSLLFNTLLENGEMVKLAKMEEYSSYGTPEELRRYM
jgi:dTDP-glucose pyrophosphorylase